MFEISLKLIRPFMQELVSRFKHRIGLLLTFKVLSHKVDLHVRLSLTIADLTLQLMHSSSEFLRFSFVACDKITEGILLGSIFGLQVSHFLSIIPT